VNAGKVANALHAARRWWFWPAPLARIAMLRAVLYLFTIWDIFYLTHDVIGHGYSIELYQPTLIARVLPFPDPTPTGGYVMQWTLVLTCLATPVLTALPQRAAQIAGRVTGWVAGIVFLAWMENSQGFGYVSHDHMALVIALLLLPTIQPARFGTTERSEAAGWALRCVQIAVVMTYFGSALVKIVHTGGFFAWPNSSIFAWSVLRRGSGLVRWSVDYPVLLKVGQWILFLIELSSPVVLWLRGRALYAAIVLFLCFHLLTYVALGISFIPTVVCWLAFVPLERIVPAVRRRLARSTAGGPADPAASAVGAELR
jgi:hypothetical protein